jgi:hypothetical protein
MIENLSTITTPYFFIVVEINSFYTQCPMQPTSAKQLVVVNWLVLREKYISMGS